MAKSEAEGVLISVVDEETRKRFLKRLENHYARVLREARWIAFAFGGQNDEEDSLQLRARELVHEVAFRIVQGDRAWREDVAFVAFMKWQMKSVASGDWKKNCRNDSLEAEFENEDGNRTPKRQLAADDNPWENALGEHDAAARVYELLDAAGGDERLTSVIDAYLTGECERPRDVAARLKITAEDVYQAERKLERRVTSRRKKENL